MGRLLFIYPDRNETLALPLLEFIKTYELKNILMFPQEPGSALTLDDKENRYYSKTNAALLLNVPELTSETSPDRRLLVKYFGLNSGKILMLTLSTDRQDPESVVGALTRLGLWIQSSGLLKPDEETTSAEIANQKVYHKLDGLLKSVVLDLNGQEKQQMALDLFFQVMKARHNKSRSESEGLKNALIAQELLEELKVLGKTYLKLTRKGREIALLEQKNRPKNLLQSVFKKT